MPEASIRNYLLEQPLTGRDIVSLRAYLRDWIDAPARVEVIEGTPDYVQRLASLRKLRVLVKRIKTRDDIRDWINKAIAEGGSPL